MPWQPLPEQTLDIIKKYVSGKAVYDIGAGDLIHARTLASLGAEQVFAIDKDSFSSVAGHLPDNVHKIKAYLNEIPEIPKESTLWLSWPVNRDIPSLDKWIDEASTVIYFGRNDDTVCGNKSLWTQLSGREVLSYLDVKCWNGFLNLTVYGKSLPLGEKRDFTPEEKRALSTWGW